MSGENTAADSSGTTSKDYSSSTSLLQSQSQSQSPVSNMSSDSESTMKPSSRPIPIASSRKLKITNMGMAQSLPAHAMCPDAPIIGSMPTPSSFYVPRLELPPSNSNPNTEGNVNIADLIDHDDKSSNIHVAVSAPTHSGILHHVSFKSRKRRSLNFNINNNDQLSQSFTFGMLEKHMTSRNHKRDFIITSGAVPEEPEKEALETIQDDHSFSTRPKVLSFMEDSFLEGQIQKQQSKFSNMMQNDMSMKMNMNNQDDVELLVDHEDEEQFLMEGDSPKPA
mmetsp:Transcript_10841/g.12427  ORF Transcript_10841/g.12427 Transcript_10841/m.12427 type:complete len:280 (+) Transcript_10841:236-1075(+)